MAALGVKAHATNTRTSVEVSRMRGVKMDDAIWAFIAKFLWAPALAVCGWLGRGMHSDIKDLKKSDAACKLDLANFKTEVANNYAKETTVQSSLARIHDRIDEGFAELRNDIRAYVGKK